MAAADQIHPIIRKCLGVHRAFRKLGFEGKDIFVGRVNEDDVVVQLRTQGKTFTVTVAKSTMEGEEFGKHYQTACAIVNSDAVPVSEMERMFEESMAGQDSVGFVTALLAKGIKYPKAFKEEQSRIERN